MIICFLGLHKWKKVGNVMPIKDDDEFSNSIDMMALGKCCKCGKLQFRKAFGSYTYNNSDKKTKKEYMENWRENHDDR